ncbi:thymosin beta-4-like [Equus asinus]|uniref:Thymosin beta-4-like n=1 Tax=Equus przewalskii TaxID=9798 RepID=A0ABM4N797_EQUPR|nr:thymosin beta-4-like [Equus asinus]
MSDKQDMAEVQKFKKSKLKKRNPLLFTEAIEQEKQGSES